MKFIKAIALLAIIGVSACAQAETDTAATQWALDSANSRVNFISIKKGNIGESHIFTDVSGTINGGTASIVIKPDSVDTRVPIRNQRMRDFLFETGIYPSIEVGADVNSLLSQLEVGSSLIASVPASLSMHGVSKDLDLQLRINKLSPSSLIVSSTQPVLIRAADYNMIDGIAKLSTLVNNLAIAESVPVSFSLQFTATK
ncbi:MAG: polyisoprenoid-binding protein YceI [Arenicella sp.]|jgi:polyisoprenoid-binding protein YceI